jgi:hypothetical protein
VFANFGGVPLAFIFIATIGSSGLVSQWLTSLGFNPYNHGFTLYSLLGVVIVYLYLQIPLMVLVILPALEGLPPGVAGSGREPRRAQLGILAVRSRPGAAALIPGLRAAAVRGSAHNGTATGDSQLSPGALPPAVVPMRAGQSAHDLVTV